MAIKKFNAVAGLSVGSDGSIDVVDENGNVNAPFLTVAQEANISSIIASTINANAYFGDAGNLSNINGVNVVGAVSEAAYSLAAGSANTANTADAANYVINSNQPNITSIGTLVDLNVSNTITTANLIATFVIGDGSNLANINGANVSEVPNANYATYSLYTLDANLANLANSALTVVGNDQPNITSVGNLGGLVVLGNSTLESVTANILSANGIVSNSTLYVAGDATINGNLVVYGKAIYADVSSLVVQDPIIEQGGLANGAPLPDNDGLDRGQVLHYYSDNVSAPVDAFMGWKNEDQEFAFVSNGSLVNNIVTIHQYGNVHANMFIGNGALLTDINGSNITGVGNANYANYAGNAFSVDAANIVGEISNANYATYSGTAYSVDGANVIGEIPNANYATYSGTSYSVSGSNVVGTVANANYSVVAATAYSVDGSNVLGEVSNANYSTYTQNVLGNSQPNITSLGTLTSLSVSGNIVANNITANANILAGNGNITGTLAVDTANAENINVTGSIVSNNIEVTSNLSLGNILLNSLTSGLFVGADGGNLGQTLTATGSNTVEWRSKFYVGPLPPMADGIWPNYGDIWFYVENGESRMYMWVTDGESDFFYDFLPPMF